MTSPQKPPLCDSPADSTEVTDYDLALAPAYLRLLDADAEGADWEEAATIVLGLDCKADPHRARQIHASHLARAKWMTRDTAVSGPKAGTA